MTVQGAPVVELHTPSAPSRVQKHKPSFNLSRSGPLGYSVWLVLSSWCDYPIGNHLCGDCRACSCAIPPETDVSREKKKEYQTKLWVSVVLEALFTCTISDTTKIGVGITTGNVNMMSLSLSLSFCRSNRKKWCLNIGSECFKKKTHKKTNKKWSFKSALCIFRTQIVLVKLRKKKRRDIWKHICAEFIICGIRKMKQTATQSTSVRLTSNGGHYFRHHLPSVCQVPIDTRWKVNGRWERKCFNAALPRVACVRGRAFT